jgi:UDP-glucose 4-epimerase
MNEILVTGGAGYIGSHTVRTLINAGYTPVIIDSLVYGHRESIPEDITFYEGDIGDKALLNKIFTQHSIIAVMHFSAFASVGESVTNPQKYYENNVVKTMILLNTMLAHNIKTFIFSSTCSLYGNTTVAQLNEQQPINPINPYAFTKYTVERILADYDKAYGLKYIALRYFNAAGADDDGCIGESHNPENHLIPLALKAITDKTFTLQLFGEDYPTPDGTCIRDYIHVYDLADAHVRALKRVLETKTSDVFNLGTEKGNSVKEVITTCESVTGKKVKQTIVPRRAGDPDILVADATKAKNILGWQPKYTLQDVIRTAWNWEQHRKY